MAARVPRVPGLSRHPQHVGAPVSALRKAPAERVRVMLSRLALDNSPRVVEGHACYVVTGVRSGEHRSRLRWVHATYVPAPWGPCYLVPQDYRGTRLALDLTREGYRVGPDLLRVLIDRDHRHAALHARAEAEAVAPPREVPTAAQVAAFIEDLGRPSGWQPRAAPGVGGEW